MDYLHAYILECPLCGFKGGGALFNPSCADECFCPECEVTFCVEFDDDDEDEQDDEMS